VSTVTDPNTILVLENGRILERGTHGGLIADDGKYADLYASRSVRGTANALTYYYSIQDI
jgi:ABC-type multidrug transport system fused ATPase/permease subunit